MGGAKRGVMARPSATRASLLRAVREAPESDEPRLAFAHWLAGRRTAADKARAEFIEVQLKWAHRRTSRTERMRLLLRDRQLRQEFEDEWLKEVPEALRSCTFRRGFIEELAADGVAFVKGASELFAQEAVQQVTFWNTTPRVVAQLADCRSLLEVRRLSFCDYEGGRNNALGPLGVSALAASPYVRGLEALDIDGANAGDAAIKALVTSPNLQQLRSLIAAGNGLSPGCAAALADSALPRQLETLHLGDSDLGADGVRQLRTARWHRLRDLGLSYSGLDASTVAELLDANALPRLQKLWVNGHHLGVEGARKVARAPGLRRIRELGVANCGLGAAGLTVLVNWAPLERIQWLHLAGNDLGARGALALASSKRLSALRGLNLDDNGMGPQGAKALAAAPFFRRLHRLYLDGNGVGASGLRHLLLPGRLRGLEKLTLNHNGLDDDAARLLLSWPGLRGLELLGVDDGNFISKKMQTRLMAAFRGEVGQA